MVTIYCLPTSDYLADLATVYPGGSHYAAVDDPVGANDGDSSYVQNNSPWKLDLYGFADPGIVGIINSITVHYVASRRQTYWPQIYPYIRVSGTNYAGAGFTDWSGTAQNTFYARSATWNSNPATSNPWIPSDLASLKFGQSIVNDGRVTACYIGINYTPLCPGGAQLIGPTW